MLVVHLSQYIPGLPPLSIITVVGLCVVAACLLLYAISRVPELLLVSAISFIYAAVPVISLIQHMQQ